jgi:hypothetical protein
MLESWNGVYVNVYPAEVYSRHLRSDHPFTRKLHRDRELYTMGMARLAKRARLFHRTAWWTERRRELNQLIWTTCPVCCNLRAGVF